MISLDNQSFKSLANREDTNPFKCDLTVAVHGVGAVLLRKADVLCRFICMDFPQYISRRSITARLSQEMRYNMHTGNIHL